MILVVLNYSIRIIIILLGILFLSGALPFKNANPDLMRVMGIVFILFGAYRLISYYTGRKRLLGGGKNGKKYDFTPDKNIEDKDEDKNI